MRVAITGGTGFVGRHLARALAADGHEVVLLARGIDPGAGDAGSMARFVAASVTEEDSLTQAMEGCAVVFHCAGINRETGTQTYRAVHVDGTRNVVNAAKRAGVGRIALLSYLRARPDCGSGYLESKWEAEEIVRGSGIGYLVVKAGMIFGRGDHMLDHTAKSIGTFRLFTTVGIRDRVIQPVAIDDVVEVLRRFAAVDERLSDETIGLVGPERLTLGELATRAARAMGRRAVVVPVPIWALYVIAAVGEVIMKIPLISTAQLRLLREGSAPGPLAAAPPSDLVPSTRLDEASIAAGLPERSRYALGDLRRPRLGALVEPTHLVLETDIRAPADRCMELCLTIETHLGVPGSRETVVGGVRTGVMALGDHVTWESRRFGLPVRMTSKITELEAPRHFVDEMQKGPFRTWRHRHEFVRVDGSTRMTDRVGYSLPLGPLGAIADRVFVRRYMTGLLRKQNEHVRELAEGSSE